MTGKTSLQLKKSFKIISFHIQKGLQKFSNNIFVKSLVSGFVSTMPIILVASFFILIYSIPEAISPDYLGAGKDEVFNYFKAFCVRTYQFTYGILGMLVTGNIARAMMDELNLKLPYNNRVKSFNLLITGMVIYLILAAIPFASSSDFNIASDSWFDGIFWSQMGAQGILPGIIVGLSTPWIFYLCYKYNITIRMPKAVPGVISQSFLSIIPFAFSVLIWSLISYGFILGLKQPFVPWLFDQLAGFIPKPIDIDEFNKMTADQQQAVINQSLNAFSNSYGIIVLYKFLECFSWFIGVHPEAIQGVFESIMAINMEMNNVLASLNRPESFVFVNSLMGPTGGMGGTGATFVVPIICLLFCKSDQLKVSGKTSVIPTSFQVNEPILFGAPIILNPYYLIPFIAVPTLNSVAAKIFVDNFGLVATKIDIPWATPWFIRGPLAHNAQPVSFLLFAICFALSFVIYLPFVLIHDKALAVQEKLKMGEKNFFGITGIEYQLNKNFYYDTVSTKKYKSDLKELKKELNDKLNNNLPINKYKNDIKAVELLEPNKKYLIEVDKIKEEFNLDIEQQKEQNKLKLLELKNKNKIKLKQLKNKKAPLTEIENTKNEYNKNVIDLQNQLKITIDNINQKLNQKLDNFKIDFDKNRNQYLVEYQNKKQAIIDDYNKNQNSYNVKYGDNKVEWIKEFNQNKNQLMIIKEKESKQNLINLFTKLKQNKIEKENERFANIINIIDSKLSRNQERMENYNMNIDQKIENLNNFQDSVGIDYSYKIDFLNEKKMTNPKVISLKKDEIGIHNNKIKKINLWYEIQLIKIDRSKTKDVKLINEYNTKIEQLKKDYDDYINQYNLTIKNQNLINSNKLLAEFKNPLSLENTNVEIKQQQQINTNIQQDLSTIDKDKTYNILVLCIGAGTSAMLANSIKDGANQQSKIKVKANALAYDSYKEALKDTDLIITSPQLRSYLASIEKDAQQFGIKVVPTKGKQYIDLTNSPKDAIEFVKESITGNQSKQDNSKKIDEDKTNQSKKEVEIKPKQENKTYNILVLCIGAGTSAMLANSIKDGANQQSEIKVKANALAYDSYKEALKDTDLIITSPQLRSYLASIEKDAQQFGIKVVPTKGKQYIDLTNSPKDAIEFVKESLKNN